MRCLENVGMLSTSPVTLRVMILFYKVPKAYYLTLLLWDQEPWQDQYRMHIWASRMVKRQLHIMYVDQEAYREVVPSIYTTGVSYDRV